MSNPSTETTRRTFRLEMWRSVPVGILEFMFLPFAGLVALEFFKATDGQKAYLLAVAPMGLVCSLFIVPLVRRLGWSATGTGAVLNIVAAAAITIAAFVPESLTVYLVALGVGMFAFMLPIPLLTQIYQENFPTAKRGKLYAVTTIFRGVIVVLFALAAGDYLKADIHHYSQFLWLFAFVAAWTGVLIWRMPRVEVTAGSMNPFTAFRWLRDDKKFRVLIVSWMMMGLGNLTQLKLWVEYLANREYGSGFNAWEVTLLTVVIPSTVKLAFTYPWGWLFDRFNFYFLRVIMNCLFTAAVLVVFLGEGFWVIAIGTGLQGFAFAGGNIAWSLWVTKLAPPEHTAEYMSVHTFTTGVRGFLAPFIGFWLLTEFGNYSVAMFSATLMTLASIILIPELRSIRARRRGEHLAPRDPTT